MIIRQATKDTETYTVITQHGNYKVRLSQNYVYLTSLPVKVSPWPTSGQSITKPQRA